MLEDSYCWDTSRNATEASSDEISFTEVTQLNVFFVCDRAVTTKTNNNMI